MRQVNLYFAIYFFFMSMREYYLFKRSTAAAQLAQIHLFQPFFFPETYLLENLMHKHEEKSFPEGR